MQTVISEPAKQNAARQTSSCSPIKDAMNSDTSKIPSVDV